MHAFASSQGRAGEQSLLHPAMMALMVLGALSMRRHEWSTPRAAVVVAAVICFFLYLFVPNTGFGGDEIKIRFAWAIFVLGCLVALTVDRAATDSYAACDLRGHFPVLQPVVHVADQRRGSEPGCSVILHCSGAGSSGIEVHSSSYADGGDAKAFWF